ncbi:recombinase family protein [Arsenicicoccus dermatophilus]|uniref:recombinase family protein n=1 Tax=Arsenicicoccus dermatophilus TaxID=1076331 RepID=UPI003B9812D0
MRRAGRVVGYARVSSRGQDVRAQVRELRAAGVHDVVTETTSGAGRRPALDALVADLEAGELVSSPSTG